MDPLEIELELFKKFVSPSYQISEAPMGMVVGAMLPHEGQVLREYFKSFGKSDDKIKIAGCNIMAYPKFDNPALYNLEINNRLFGDARMSYPYDRAKDEFDRRIEDRFDLVYIRNPSLVKLDDWTLVFSRAIGNIGNNGAVVSLIREEDLPRNELFKKQLKAERNISPVGSFKTGVKIKDLETYRIFGNFFHTLEVYKKV